METSIITILPDHLQNELDTFGFTKTVAVDEGAAYDYFAKNGKISITSILKRHNFKRIKGVRLLNESWQAIYKGKTELAIEIYKNPAMNIFFALSENEELVDVKYIKELEKYIKDYGIILSE